MGVTEFWLCIILLLPQDDGAKAPAPPPLDPKIVMARARLCYRDGNYADAINHAFQLAEQSHLEAMLLVADANFEIGSPRTLRRAIEFYQRYLYESDDPPPFSDHAYYQLGQIFMGKSHRAQAKGALYEAREMAEEAKFYMRRLLVKYPDSYYRDTTRNQLLDLALSRNHYSEALKFARDIWNSSTNGRLLTRVEPLVFIHQEPFEEDFAAIDNVFGRHREFIMGHRDTLLAYATRFEEAGDLDRARRLFLMIYNLWPEWGDSATSLGRLADLHRRLGQWNEATLLYKMILEDNTDAVARANAWLGLAEMMEQGRIHEVLIDEVERLNYPTLVAYIRTSVLPDEVRARYSYKLALFKSFSNSEEALRILRILLNEYERGPFVGLYRSFYERLLFTTIDLRYAAGDDWGLDRLYTDHHQFLAFTVQTKYPHMIAKAYLRLDLPSSALQVYEAMWSYKDSINGFDLAYEEPLTDYLLLLNTMRGDRRLSLRLRDYYTTYRRNGRFMDQYRYVDTMHKSRDPQLSRAQFFEFLKALPTKIGTLYDARRLRLMAVTAQTNALYYNCLLENPECEVDAQTDQQVEKDAGQPEAEDLPALRSEAWALAETWYEEALRWPRLAQEFPVLQREARLFQADRLYNLGNYFESERRYQQILANESYTPHDRDWAYLQLARLHELKGEVKTSLRIYGQLAYAEDAESRMLASYAKQRLFSIASKKKIEGVAKEMGLGQ